MYSNLCDKTDPPQPPNTTDNCCSWTRGYLIEFGILGIYVSVNTAILLFLFHRDWPALWERYGDTDRYWDTVFAHMHWCQFMIIQPVVLLSVWLILTLTSRPKVSWWITILVMILVECINISLCLCDAFGIEV